VRLARASSLPAFAAALAGILFACWMYGAAVIDPRSTGWLTRDDAATHFAGLIYFLNQPWHWPPGLMINFGDEPTSVVFTDCIPLLALPAKLLGVSGRVQYFGLWFVACHALAGWWGCRLLQCFGTRGVAAFAGALFVVISPTILLRAYGHESLMGQFLVVAALARALRDEWRWRGWLVLLVVAVLVHAYLATMVGVIGIAAAMSALWRGRAGLLALVAQGAASLCVLVAVAWIAGYFVGSGDVLAEGYGHFSANLLTWVDPLDWAEFNRTWGRVVPYAHEWSRYLHSAGQATNGQYEGFAYLGAGMLLLAVIAVALLASHDRTAPAGEVPLVSRIAVTAACLLMLLLAISTRVTLGPHTLVELEVPEGFARALGAYRASGRFVWPLTYLLVAWAISRVSWARAGAWIVIAALLLQCADLSGKMRELRIRFHEPPLPLELDNPVWSKLLTKCPRVQLVSQVHPGDGWFGPAIAAGERGVLFAPAPTSRYSIENDKKREAGVHALLEQQGWKRGVVYVLAPPMPPGMTIASVIGSLPDDVRYLKLGYSRLVFHESCIEP
jgi:hypothetical protein